MLKFTFFLRNKLLGYIIDWVSLGNEKVVFGLGFFFEDVFVLFKFEDVGVLS